MTRKAEIAVTETQFYLYRKPILDLSFDWREPSCQNNTRHQLRPEMYHKGEGYLTIIDSRLAKKLIPCLSKLFIVRNYRAADACFLFRHVTMLKSVCL